MSQGRAEGPLHSLHLILMSRAPVPGQSKTRLTPPLTAMDARDFHVACLNDLLAEGRAWRLAREAAGGPPVSLHLFITPPASQPAFRQAGVTWPNDYALHNQRGRTLGERMARAIEQVRTTTAQPAAVVLAGTDLPLLGGQQFDEAIDALRLADVVFGPTTDGGYYLVAVRDDPAGLFDLDGWGGSTVLERSLAAARRRGWSTALITPLPDADTADDLREILAHPRAARFADRASLRFLRERLGGA